MTEQYIIVNGKTIECRQGDIAEVDTDAIVNAANNHLWMGSGVAGAIKRKGGQIIEEEAIKKGPIEVGQAVATGAGRLKARYVIHAAVMGQDLVTDAESIEKATLNSLQLADKLKLRSIAFPALGTGVGGFPIDECARIMIAQAVDFLKNSRSIEKIIFVLFDNNGLASFAAIFGEFGDRI